MRTKLTEEHKQKIREYYIYNNNPMLGKQYGDEVRKKMSEGQKKRYEDPEERERASIKQKQRFENIEERKKISETQKKRLTDPELRKRISKAVIRITENGIIEEYFGAREAERQTGIKASAISACCKGKRKTAGNSLWMYKEDYLEKKIEVV